MKYIAQSIKAITSTLGQRLATFSHAHVSGMQQHSVLATFVAAVAVAVTGCCCYCCWCCCRCCCAVSNMCRRFTVGHNFKWRLTFFC